MTWRVEFLDEVVLAEFEVQPADIKARFLRITRLTTRTLERFAKATHTRLRISFKPGMPRADGSR